MTDLPQNLNTQTPAPAPVANTPIARLQTVIKNLIVKIWPLINPVWQKVYSNKKVFWLVTGVFGLLFLVLILGLLFGKRNGVVNTVNNSTPTPQSQTTPKPIVNDQFSSIEQNLNALKNQIDNLDVKQSQLQPPSVNFDVKF